MATLKSVKLLRLGSVRKKSDFETPPPLFERCSATTLNQFTLLSYKNDHYSRVFCNLNPVIPDGSHSFKSITPYFEKVEIFEKTEADF